ncbi:hypothetical protein D3C77_535470 [compost metagenome]
MVLEVFTHPRQVMTDFNAGRFQHRLRTDTRALEQVWRADRAGGHQHLAVAVDLVSLAALIVFHTHRPLAIEQNAPGHGMGDDSEVRPGHRRAQVGIGGGPTHAVLHRHVHGTEAFLHIAIAVIGLDVASLGPRFHPGAVQRVLHVVAVVGGQWSGAAAVVITTELERLGAFEVRQTVPIVPVLRTQALPFVKVTGMATDIDQAVDRG